MLCKKSLFEKFNFLSGSLILMHPLCFLYSVLWRYEYMLCLVINWCLNTYIMSRREILRAYFLAQLPGNIFCKQQFLQHFYRKITNRTAVICTCWWEDFVQTLMKLMRKMCSWCARRSWYSSGKRTVNSSALGSPPLNGNCCAEDHSTAGSGLMQVPSPLVWWNLACFVPDPPGVARQRGWQMCSQIGPSGVPGGPSASECPAKGDVRCGWEGVLEVGAGLHNEPTEILSQ